MCPGKPLLFLNWRLQVGHDKSDAFEDTAELESARVRESDCVLLASDLFEHIADPLCWVNALVVLNLLLQMSQLWTTDLEKSVVSSDLQLALCWVRPRLLWQILPQLHLNISDLTNEASLSVSLELILAGVLCSSVSLVWVWLIDEIVSCNISVLCSWLLVNPTLFVWLAVNIVLLALSLSMRLIFEGGGPVSSPSNRVELDGPGQWPRTPVLDTGKWLIYQIKQV